MAKALVKAIRNLTSDHGYKAIASLVDEIPLLRGQIESKSKEAFDLSAEIIQGPLMPLRRISSMLSRCTAACTIVYCKNDE